jgi:hypothetical protein
LPSRAAAHSLTKARTIYDPQAGRLQLWSVRGPAPWRFVAPELIEHVGHGEFAWLARDGDGTVSWMLDAQPVTLLELLDLVTPSVGEWVMEQTLALLGPVLAQIAALPVGGDGEPLAERVQLLSAELEADPKTAAVAELMEEFNRFSSAAYSLMERLMRLFPEPAAGPSRAMA